MHKLINTTIVTLLLALAAMLWKGNPWLGLVVGAALAVNTLIAVSIGGVVPLLLKRFKLDPAAASGPIGASSAVSWVIWKFGLKSRTWFTATPEMA